MKPFVIKVYVVQREAGEIVAAKLTFMAAHTIAKAYAPAKVLLFMADKSDQPNSPDLSLDHEPRNQLRATARSA